MSVARVLELSAVSPESHEAAIREAVDRATRTLRGVHSAWVKDMNVLIENNAISGFQVNLAFTFVLEEGEAIPEFEGTMGATTDEDIRRGSSADIGSASGTLREDPPPGEVQRETSPEPSPGTQEERPVR